MNRNLLALPLFALALAGCTQTGIICTSDEVRCGQTCANLNVNPDHCGECGVACATGFACVSGACVCSGGFTQCGQACVDLRSAPNNCGACGNVCASGEFCVDAGCASGPCPTGSTECGGGCVNTAADRLNCGGCADGGGTVCGQGQACKDGVCESDIYAACFNSGAVYALDGQSETVSPDKAVAPPSEPSGLAFNGPNSLAVVDQLANDVYTFDLSAGGFGSVDSFAVGQGPSQIAVAGGMAAVVNAQDGTLDILRASGAGWERVCPADAGGCAASVHFDADSSPEYAAFTPGAVYVSLQGNTLKAEPTGNQLARVSLDDLSVQLTDLSAVDLQMPDGGTQPRPNGVAVGGGHVYVALANLPFFTLSGGAQGPFGPGLVAVLDEVDGGAPVLHALGDGGTLQPVALGTGCFNAGSVLLSGHTLYVACSPTYAPVTFEPVNPGALAALDVGALTPTFAPQVLACPADAGGCKDGAASRMALADGKLFVGDINDGRLFVADPATGALVNGPQNPLLLCPAPDGGYNFISDVVARP